MSSYEFGDPRLPERFWEKVSVCEESGCWLWTGATTRRGYGLFRWQRKTVKSHRLIYSLMVAPVSARLEIDHQCHQRACSNPTHLRLATHQQNMQNMRSGRGSSGCKGVSWYKRKSKWYARIGVNWRDKHLGYFDNELDAALAYDAAALELFGPFAATNASLGLLPVSPSHLVGGAK
jgi:hypothetical protein